MEPYVGIVVMELAKKSSSSPQSFFREDFYIVYAESDEKARERVEAMANEQADGEDVKVRHIVDVAPALYGYVDRDCDLYSRHFANLEDYERFEMKLGGTDPLAD
ncbi:DUF4288 domain-containing protein [Corynebacterium aurimucosum]|uniref:DUF4288 domain-containing protein n=1 Tax=Corynebacterium intestinale TaxID=2943492 RepID=A0ABT0T819_9CORY|nr:MULTISPECIES: DUF4288 domain-containing protein [Corynebacterium]MBE7363822.1 DUF4288 domain-containing protein [Corynebacterium aurimucosum]MCL8493177.1 DUF4288 domain-containing protein [Corynebacterium intestinale]MCP1389409.1 DUF4288 domain-containing protein [Corynebacterium intestinale]MDK8764425.1 DUF4288 domain-containing protein [Corynebacterium sp. MSK218]MDK8897350.1 DUF4288 domain-containing protein [Corynebacterium sp. MSK004]